MGTYNDYKKKGFTDFLSQMFAKMDMEMVMEREKSNEEKAYEEQRELDHNIYTQQMDRLTDLIKINHK